MQRTAHGHGLRTGARAALLGLALTAASDADAASSVLIWPINPTIEAEQKAAALWLENRGQQPVGLQVRVMAWRQGDFDDRLDAQRSVIGSPPVVTIAPGKRQMIRLIATQPAPAGTEQAYRVLVDEMLQPGAVADPQLGVKFQMRYSVPLFAYGAGLWSKEDSTRQRDPKSAGVPELSWRKVAVDGRNYVELRNQGAVHARLTDVAFKQAGQIRPLVEGLLGYVLPGAIMRWPLPAAPTTDAVLQVRVNGAPQVQSVAPAR